MRDKNDPAERTIALNKRARHESFIEEQFEAGLELQGWEVKSLRDGRAQITDAYVTIKKGEAWLIGAQIQALQTASTHIRPDVTRTRKLLLHAKQIDKLIGATERKGYTLVALNMHWTRGNAKIEIGLAKGKQDHDKRATIKERDWQRETSLV